MNTQFIFQFYPQKVYTFLDKFLTKKAKEAQKKAKETFYFIDILRKFIPKDEENKIAPILSYLTYKNLGGKDEKNFLYISAALALENYFFLVHHLTDWENNKLSPFIKNIFKKYEDDKTKKDPLHISFSQSLILGDIISGFGYELVLASGFSNHQKIKIFDEINNIIKWQQMAKIEEITGKNNRQLLDYKIKYLFELSIRIGAYLARGEKMNEKFITSLAKGLGERYLVKNENIITLLNGFIVSLTTI